MSIVFVAEDDPANSADRQLAYRQDAALAYTTSSDGLCNGSYRKGSQGFPERLARLPRAAVCDAKQIAPHKGRGK
jgi:hypothetical protein